jgi:hypothetical protein
MGLIRPSSLLLGAILAGPALWRGFVTGQLDVASALLRFVLGVLVGAVMLAVLRAVTSGYGRRAHGTDEAPDVRDPGPG